MLIRPVQHKDLEDIHDLVSQSGFGLTNLPKDRDLIAQRIEESMLRFSGDPVPEKTESAYLLVMEDTASGRVVGTGGIKPRIGVGAPFFAYRVDVHIKDSPSLKIHKEVECLHLLSICDGPAEIGALFVHPEFQRYGHGRLMSLSRFLFIAEHKPIFPTTVIAEMRGVIEREGRSPFWEALGRHFFDMDFPRADHLSARDKAFIAELMPRHPIYTVLLPETARAAIGQVHEQTRPALKLLQQEGFEYAKMIDIFDAGPVVRCDLERIRTVRESRTAGFSQTLPATEGDTPWLIATGRLLDFRACLGAIAADGTDRVRISARAAAILGLAPGALVRYAPLRPGQAAQVREHE